jgi:hypothetical protein
MQPTKPNGKTATRPFSLNKPASKEVKVIEKEVTKPKQGFTEFPTAKLTSIKTVDPFSEKKGNSFAHLYSSGAIPCKIEHGSVHMRLKWNPNVVISRINVANKNCPTTLSSLLASMDSLRKNTPMALSPSTSART